MHRHSRTLFFPLLPSESFPLNLPLEPKARRWKLHCPTQPPLWKSFFVLYQCKLSTPPSQPKHWRMVPFPPYLVRRYPDIRVSSPSADRPFFPTRVVLAIHFMLIPTVMHPRFLKPPNNFPPAWMFGSS